MKLIIDINDHEYIGIKQYPNNITSYPVTIHLYDAVRNGTPLENIRAEIEALEKPYRIHTEDEYTGAWNDAIDQVLTIIDKYRK